MRVKGQQNCYEITFKHLELIFQEIFDQLLTFYLDRRVAGTPAKMESFGTIVNG